MAPSIVHLPNGQNLTVTPVFGGLSFKTSELSNHHSVFPPGWTIVIHAEEDDDESDAGISPQTSPGKEHWSLSELGTRRKQHVNRFQKPSLKNDHLFISSISNPANADFKPAVSPTRQIAMMLWATLWWYFHQPEPVLQLDNPFSSPVVPAGRPKGDWKIYIKREGIFKGRHLLQKLERMGLLVNEDSSVGADLDDSKSPCWSQTYITRRHFWQLDPRIYLFTLSPAVNSPFPGSPVPSRSASPSRNSVLRDTSITGSMTPPLNAQQGQWTITDPFHSTSHLPTYFPPAPTHYTWTNNIRHPHRQKPPRQGEVFYTRYVPSLGEILSFRVASMAPAQKSHTPARTSTPPGSAPLRGFAGVSDQIIPTISSLSMAPPGVTSPCDVELLHKWMNDERVAASWGETGPIEHQQAFLEDNLKKKHSFPVIGCFDGKPFGYFEIYWVKEDHLGPHISSSVGDWDRGIHLLVGEQEFRGSHRVRVWLSALAHYCWLADPRTNAVMLEPRVDNEKIRRYCEDVGFFKEREISFPNKQSNLMKIYRDTWEAPFL
ncbi:hypothetical protein K461DRAFT_310923 [Myriangium duriaei CBS 260.36]|uniref:Acyltransferase MbtK/IucB-like conserved domain-containing protein n=1 Tax=Myriangium duriaei CBS 260.36 TaxID=1168546 RepID=A0A9P4JCS7_9PEZI|nr:hypothetical protein K461DRAFT_310923 [Myriangium duriaei CBS 260.36]